MGNILDEDRPQDLPERAITSFHIQCPKCGQDGRLRKKTHRIKSKPPPDFRTRPIRINDEVIDRERIRITSRSHPYRYMPFLDILIGGGIKQRPHPTINPSVRILKPGDHGYEKLNALVQSIHQLGATIAALGEIMPLVVEKHPYLTLVVNRWTSCWSVVQTGWHSTVDGRYDRSLFEWVDICLTAVEEGVGVAAKKYSGSTEDGKEVRLSHKHIKDMIPVVAKFAASFPYCWTDFMTSTMIISEIISNDADLLEVYYGMEKYYEEETGRRQGNGQGPSVGSADIKAQIGNGGDPHAKKYKYTYFYVRHNDGERGPFKESKFPDDVIEEFERSR